LNLRNFRLKLPAFDLSTTHYESTTATTNISESLQTYISPFVGQPLVLICIGTDRSTGDCLGPLIGTKLLERGVSHFHIFGTLENPVHALNLVETMEYIKTKFRKPFIIGIDACLGSVRNIGNITVGKGPVKPGAAVNKKLPEVGNIHVTGTVNISGFMEFAVLQNTRLNTVMKMAETIATSISKVDETLKRESLRLDKK
jgi:putative sporulation protein YyaC